MDNILCLGLELCRPSLRAKLDSLALYRNQYYMTTKGTLFCGTHSATMPQILQQKRKTKQKASLAGAYSNAGNYYGAACRQT